VVTPSECNAHVVADSVTPWGARLTTMVVTLPRSALAELNTHRAFSRNSSSSRAVPIDRMIAFVRQSPYVPRAFSLHKPGMNAHGFVGPDSSQWATILAWWMGAAESAIAEAERGLQLGLHKQDVNRILEPFMMHTVVVSSTAWDNFFRQRLALDPAGAPLAYLPLYDAAASMRDALLASSPTLVPESGWHTPFVTEEEASVLSTDEAREVSAARCARVSYFTPTGTRVVGQRTSVDADLALCQRLLRPSDESAPHLSPFEHVATPDRAGSGNFSGWRQWRKSIETVWLRDATATATP
jgi:hypothetical protein